ncbi:MAG: APC family permease [Candidatus Bathyarchaeia archaeon]
MSEEKTLFLRRATGLVRAWSLTDAFMYSALSVNIVTLGMYAFSFGSFLPQHNLVPAILISWLIIFLEIIAYCGLISVMPRAGGDYVWQSRVLHPLIGFIFAWNCWVSVLWLWGPIYGQMLVWEFISPLLVLFGKISGNPALYSAALWWTTPIGTFIATLITIAFVFIYVGLGMRNYARIQKTCFILGTIGVLAFIAIIAALPQSAFIEAFNKWWPEVTGQTVNYHDILERTTIIEDWALDFREYPFAVTITSLSLPLIPFVVFFNLYPQWGATLYGEVRGASDFKRQAGAMALGSTFMNILAVIMLLALWKFIGYEFFNASNYLFWYYIYTGADSTVPLFPYPVLLAAFALGNPALGALIVFLAGLWFFGWSGTLFLSSTRVVFAMAFDRVLPEWFGKVTTRFRTPINCLLFMTIMTAFIGWLYCFNIGGFTRFALDAVFMIAVGYAITCIAAAIVPWRMRDAYNRAPISKYKIGGVPVITIAGILFALFLIWVMYLWAIDPVYGVNDPVSVIYLLANYIAAAIIFYAFKWYRKKQGIEVDMLYKEIPTE